MRGAGGNRIEGKIVTDETKGRKRGCPQEATCPNMSTN